MNTKKNKLDSIRPKQPNYPDADFFEKMAENVIAEHSSPFVKIPFYKNPIVRWAAAAAILIPFVFIFVLNNNSSFSHTTVFAELDNIPHTTIEEYVAEQKDESALLAFTSASSNNQAVVKKVVHQLTAEVGVEEISDYLFEEYGEWDYDDEAYLFY